MDSFEWNKIAGWTLAACIAVLGLSILTGYAYSEHRPEKMGYVVEGVEAESSGAPQAEAEPPIAMFLKAASVSKGEGQFKKCATCHTIEKGGGAKIGPNLYGIVGNKVAHSPGFDYSKPVASHGGTWGFEELNHWLTSPRKYMPGTKMSFAGISRIEDRADVIAYLNTMSDHPLPLPEPPAVAAKEPGGTGPESAKAADVPVPAPAEAAQSPEKNLGGPAATSKSRKENDAKK